MYPFNDHLPWESFYKRATILYVSHPHRDHFDDELLVNIRKVLLFNMHVLFSCLPSSVLFIPVSTLQDIPVILPRNCFPKLKKDYSALGFHNFIDAEMMVGGTTLRTFVSETENREMEDSMVLITDGETTIVNGNDCKLDGEIEEVFPTFTPNTTLT